MAGLVVPVCLLSLYKSGIRTAHIHDLETDTEMIVTELFKSNVQFIDLQTLSLMFSNHRVTRSLLTPKEQRIKSYCDEALTYYPVYLVNGRVKKIFLSISEVYYLTSSWQHADDTKVYKFIKLETDCQILFYSTP